MKLKVLLVLLLIPLLGWGAAILYDALFSFDDKIVISEERNRYIALEFTPKFTAAECAIHFDLYLKRTRGDFAVLLNGAFQRYASYREPHVGMMTIGRYGYTKADPNTGEKTVLPYELVLSDQCDRKDEIFDAMAAYALDQHGDVFDIQRTPIEGPVRAGNRFWLDSPDYDPDYWPIAHKAYRGDGAALMAIADRVAPDDHTGRYVYAALAQDFLPAGPMKEKARQTMDSAWKNIPPHMQTYANRAVINNRAQIKKFKEM